MTLKRDIEVRAKRSEGARNKTRIETVGDFNGRTSESPARAMASRPKKKERGQGLQSHQTKRNLTSWMTKL
jgi:hypothetical protein